MRRGDDTLKPMVTGAVASTGLAVHTITLSRDLHADEATARSIADTLDDKSLLLSVGSGNLTDVCKHARVRFLERTGHRVPHFCWPTANSVNAYSSGLAILIVQGVKRSLPSLAPDVILCDLPTLRSAPPAMQRAGLGDMMARCVAQGDWYLAHALGMDDDYSDAVYRLLGDAEQQLIDHADAIGRQAPDGTRVLAEALTVSGIVLSAADQTAPLSGWEHVISHYLDLVALAAGRPLALHGAQVGVGSIVSARAYEALLDRADPASWDVVRLFPTADAARTLIDRHFAPHDPGGERRAELWRDYEAKWVRWNAQRERWRAFCADWHGGGIRDHLRRLVRPARVVEQALANAGAPVSFEELDPAVNDTLSRSAIEHAHLVRRRFTLGDLLACDPAPLRG